MTKFEKKNSLEGFLLLQEKNTDVIMRSIIKYGDSLNNQMM